MNRLCIYVTYNKENKIEAYVGYMLKALREYVTTLYVVCNYSKIVKGRKEYVEPYADEIFYRENRGYDAGAYKDMLCTVLGWEEVSQYDELVMMNDSFFGPFYDLSVCFETMEKQTCDFWGMTRSYGGYFSSVECSYGPHIQSYFLGFSKNVLTCQSFRNFWKALIYPESYEKAVVNFEFALNDYFKNQSFVSMTLTDVWGMTFQENENPFLSCSLELIRDKSFPLLKKKSLLIRNAGFENAFNAVRFLEENSSYPVKWIWDIIDSQFYIEGYAPEGQNCLEFFYKKFKRIYIYGAGVCGKNLLLYFSYRGWKQEGLIVSNMVGQDTECLLFEDAIIDDETGIIVSAIREEVSREIVKCVEKRCRKEQLFIIYDCEKIRVPEGLDSPKKH